jgi:GcrA cell cycle regulator
MQIPKLWTEDRVEQLKGLWARGWSASQIGDEMGCFGHTPDRGRNAVLGKVHRMGLPARAERCADPETISLRKEQKALRNAESQRQRRGSVRTEAPRPAKPATPIAATEPFAGALNIPLMDLRLFSSVNVNQCRHIQYGAPDFRFYANPTLPGASWCGHHEQIVWMPPERRRATSPDGNRRGVKVSNIAGSYEFS